MSTNNVATISPDDGIVEIRGKRYKTVAKRVAEFRAKFQLESGWRITTDVLHRDENGVVVRAEIRDPSDRLIATGHAEEQRKGSINLTSALENCETSAIGRALSAAGMAGAEYGSADELARALEARQQYMEMHDEVKEVAHNNAPNISPVKKRKYIDGLLECVKNEDAPGLLQLWEELDNETIMAIWSDLRSYERSAIKKLLNEARTAIDPNYIEPTGSDEKREKDTIREEARAAKK